MERPERKITTMRHKVTRRFYEPLLLLDTLGVVRGGRIKSDIVPDDSGSSHIQLRRHFVDTIAYICAFSKGSDFVTAAALEKTPKGIVVWLAANSTVGEEVISFLEKILDSVHRITDQDNVEDLHQAALPATQTILSMIVDFQAPRLEVYRKQIIKTCILPCQEVLTEYSQMMSKKDRDALEIDNLQQWLARFFDNDDTESVEPNILNLVNSCHKYRHTQYMKTIGMFAGQGRTRSQIFEQLYKLLGKLGKPAKSSTVLTQAATRLAQDFVRGFTVKTVPSSRLLPLPFRTKKEGTIESIVNRMFSNLAEKNEFLNRLGFLEGEEISNCLARERSAKTRVHAELLLMDHFERNKCTFLDGCEKYIGCSKPACYLCHMYITHHPSHYVLPESHNKVYISWRLPDVFDQDVDGVTLLAIQESILLNMIESVRRDLYAEMRSRTMRPPYHTDSTTGITSTLESRYLDEAALLQSLSLKNSEQQADGENGSSNSEDESGDGGVRI